MVEDLIKRLRDTVEEEAGHGVRNEAADLIKRQAEDIAENDAIIDELRDHLTALESERDALLAAAWKEAVAIYQVQTSCNGWTDHSREEYEGARLPRRVVYTAPTAALEKGGGRDAWQPIETAPKDCVIQLWVPPFGIWIDGPWRGAWSYVAQQWTLHSPFTAADGRSISASAIPHPTHWQPLPAPPAALSQKAGEQQ